MMLPMRGRLLAVLLFVNLPVVAEPLALQQAIDIALNHNPALARAGAVLDAATQQVPQAGALPDPRLTLGLLNLPGEMALDKDPMSQVQVGFSQALPFPGTRGLKQAVAEFRADALAQNRDVLQLRVVQQVKQAWWQVFYIDRALAAVDKNRDILQQVTASAETLYSVGRGLQQDLLLAQLEQARLDDDALEWAEMRRSAVARLNRLLNHSAAQTIELPSFEPLALPVLIDERLMYEQIQQHPDVQAARAALEAARAERDLSSKARKPEFAIGATYGMRDGRDDLTSVQFSMSLPLYAGRKQARAEDQRQAELIAARHYLHEVQARIESELTIALAQYRRSVEQVQLFERSILPKAEQAVEAMLAGYQVNKIDFPRMLHAQTTLFNYETQYWQAYSRAQQSLAALAALLGEETFYE